MITIFSGMPGAGKTSYALYLARKMSKNYDRFIHFNIDGIENYGGFSFSPDTLWELQSLGLLHRSLIIVDEAQLYIEASSSVKSSARGFDSFWQTHRHYGVDVWMTTQHPMLLPTTIRRLAQCYWIERWAFNLTRVWHFIARVFHVYNAPCKPTKDS